MTLKYGLNYCGPFIILTDSVISKVVKHRQLSNKDKEAGGQLFAIFDNYNTVVIDVTEPTILDRRSRYSFVPNLFLQNMDIRSQYKKGRHYVGDWHSHPEPMPTPSDDDYKSMVDFFNKSSHELLFFLMVIAGTAAIPDCFHVCLVNGVNVQKLILIEENQ